MTQLPIVSMPVEHRSELLNRFYAPEGRYGLFSERHSGIQYFNSAMSTKLTFVDILIKEEGYHVMFNVVEQLHISSYAQTGKVCCLISLGASSLLANTAPTYHVEPAVCVCTYLSNSLCLHTDSQKISLLPRQFQQRCQCANLP